MGPRARQVHLLVGLVAPALLFIWNAWTVWDFTIDDSYISFRYARNLVNGFGLVYNPGERVEGYTNFAWTLLLAAGIKLGIDPHHAAKLLGILAGLGTLWVVHRISGILRPHGRTPTLATWWLAASIPLTGYAVFGLETSMFAFLVALGLLLMLGETHRGQGYWPSAMAFALAGLTRPEAPMFLGVAMLALGRDFLSRQNLKRGFAFAVPLLVHLMWRRGYYGEWVPMTFIAKTGDVQHQLPRGLGYVWEYALTMALPVLLAVYGLAVAARERSRPWLIVSVVALTSVAYVVLVGGDWMPGFRLLAPAEPFVVVLGGAAVRRLLDGSGRGLTVAVVVALLAGYAWQLRDLTRFQNHVLRGMMPWWKNATGATADWFVSYGPYGKIVLGDIGWVGWRTDYPIVDILGLVQPHIAKLPGSYRQKIGPEFVDAIYDENPEYMVLIFRDGCRTPNERRFAQLTEDPRFEAYRASTPIKVSARAHWCVFIRRDVQVGKHMGGTGRPSTADG